MVFASKALRDAHFVTAILLERLPGLIEMPDVAAFLVQHVLIPEGPVIWSTPESINNVLADHLVELDVTSTMLQAQLLCEDLQKACQHPSDFQTRLYSQLKQGKDLQQALTDTQLPEVEQELPPGVCALCHRKMPLTWHHLFPRDVHKKFLKRGLMTQQDCVLGISICRQCHNTIHRFFDNETLAEKLHSLESLLEEESIQKWVAYASKQKARAVTGLKVAR